MQSTPPAADPPSSPIRAAVNFSETLTLDGCLFFGRFSARDFADQPLGDMLRWVDFGARALAWAQRKSSAPVLLEAEEEMPARKELFPAELPPAELPPVIETEEVDPEEISMLERAEADYEAKKEKMPIAGFFPYKRTYCGTELVRVYEADEPLASLKSRSRSTSPAKRASPRSMRSPSPAKRASGRTMRSPSPAGRSMTLDAATLPPGDDDKENRTPTPPFTQPN
jgi:hypothetical protein